MEVVLTYKDAKKIKLQNQNLQATLDGQEIVIESPKLLIYT